uniref:cell surface glycoprotein CD200 receptor 1-A isoform X2 n=1 Tax=Monopterus albus TaxID=43700 RepID=UPI0009B2FD99|nr:cell surface glycoprotein CD200 receptor 1 isoform X2 [Monopterus albus]
MRGMMWICAVILLLVSEAWSTKPAARHLTFNKGSDAALTCSNKTWDKMIYVIWNIYLKTKTCKIGFENAGHIKDNCTDGKSLQNTSSFQSYLRIPNFSGNDVGVYKCESVYSGGSESYELNVTITVPPSVSSWLEQRDSKMVAVCKAERGKPAANISWNHPEKPSNVVKNETGGFITVESHLELPEGMDTRNLSCAIGHQYWEQDKILRPKPKQGYMYELFIPIVVVLVISLLGILYFAIKKLLMLRQCQQAGNSPSKSQQSYPTEDVEEVEPYASYVQRVNCIYN